MLVRVGTFNIHHGRGRDGVVDLNRSAEVVRKAGPELIAFQELDRGRARSGRVDQPAVLGELIGMAVHFFPTLRSHDGDYGLGIAAPDPIAPGLVSLPGVAGDEPRAALVVEWRGLSIVATHLSRLAGARRLQTDALADLATTLKPPVVVLGDLNQGPRGLRRLTAASFAVPRPWLPTVGPPWWPRRVDHILVGPGVRVRAAWTAGGGASDHRGLFAELERADPGR